MCRELSTGLVAWTGMKSPVTWLQAPQPTDPRLSLEAAGGEIIAVLRFEGSATREATEAAVARLRQALTAGLHHTRHQSLSMLACTCDIVSCTCLS